ncbi:hypothetical protein P4637_20835 [Halalkalibacterium halodurans]|jgi:arsenate reductase-like glutaredoxin family protein|uniref:Spore coat protein W (Insoluble fraction) n=2 Tax=Halalkalibacterium halodurans TaxID=86665 RepID=Q9KAU5_HALH5|nr:spore coat protein W [Halalkalibacterium halodurans]MDY7222747.1 hypothetical protein [Halalkalibacterium halodurans]MDY7241968.1 hypothetical protein [Halalkalibacterium halodurans]MED3646957.1 hypothetical protein [Halalkalibacterium halodurans]MED4082770.1 hypothetical protein [Halalkalibacterium halodurans]MED4087260.1 hypothetical protein [Halalkalibacterium halodurans]
MDLKPMLEVVVDRVLKKHGVTVQNVQIDEQEKAKIRQLLKQVESDVETFLANQQKRINKTNDNDQAPEK